MIDLKDVTFCIPIRIDHKDRLENLETLVEFLTEHFDTNIMVYENDCESVVDRTWVPEKVKFEFQYNSSSLFHRTKILNDMFKAAETPIVVNYDADVLLPVNAYLEAAEWIRGGLADIVYPYDGRFREVPRTFIPDIKSKKGVEWIEFDETFYIHHESVGGAIFASKAKYEQSGYENEYCVSHSWEDNERLARWQKLGFRIARTSNFLVHLEHYRGVNSGPTNPKYSANQLEYIKVANMTSEQVKQYIKTWSWVAS